VLTYDWTKNGGQVTNRLPRSRLFLPVVVFSLRFPISLVGTNSASKTRPPRFRC